MTGSSSSSVAEGTPRDHGPGPRVAVAFVFGASATVLVAEMVPEPRFTSLAETGTATGRLFGVGTAGAVLGTGRTGFVLVPRFPASGVLTGPGTLRVVGSASAAWRVRGRSGAPPPAPVIVTGGLAALVAPGGCDVETRDHCARADADPDRDGRPARGAVSSGAGRRGPTARTPGVRCR